MKTGSWESSGRGRVWRLDMKIGILTFHRAKNLGAALQAAALCQYLNRQFGNTEIVDFIPNNACPTGSKALQRMKRLLISLFRRNRAVRDLRFAAFRKQEMVLSAKTYYGDPEIAKAAVPYDLLISGSDQILNTTLTGSSRAFYLDFFNGNKLSYASSFGREAISETETEWIRRELPKFSALSVREQTAAGILRKEIGVEPQLVVDPVFLLDRDAWEAKCSADLQLPEKYIFVYYMEGSAHLVDAVQRVQKQTGLPVIAVRGGGKPGLFPGMEDATCGPREFLRYIRSAELVITNSFHGTAFSLIFERKLICAAHSTGNTRLENLLHLIHQDHKMVWDMAESYDDKVISENIYASDFVRYIALSKAFLQQNIGKFS